MQAYSRLSMLRSMGIKPGDPKPLVGHILLCDVCSKKRESLVALDVEWHYNKDDISDVSDVSICRNCLLTALVRLDVLEDEDQEFKVVEQSIIALEAAKEENA